MRQRDIKALERLFKTAEGQERPPARLGGVGTLPLVCLITLLGAMICVLLIPWGGWSV